MHPINGEVPQIDWPVVTIGDQRLVVRWTFFAQWLISKRKINIRELAQLMQAKDPSLIDLMVECFAAAVAENFTTRNLPAPTAEYWALAISQSGDPDKWGEVNRIFWEAVGKAPAAVATPAPQPTPQGMTTQ